MKIYRKRTNYQISYQLCICGCKRYFIVQKYWYGKEPQKYIHGHNKGHNKPHTEKTKQILSEKEKIFQNKPEIKKKKSEKTKEYFSCPGNKEKHIKIMKQAMNKPETIEKCSKSRLGHISTEKEIESLSKSGKKYWDSLDPDSKSDRIKKIYIGSSIRPNKPETVILNLLNQLYPNEWKYTGDFSFMINGKNPDFTNCNGQKKLIELFGDYWHKDENPQDRINIFKEFGYDTLVIWEKELKDMNKVKDRINEFNKGDFI